MNTFSLACYQYENKTNGKHMYFPIFIFPYFSVLFTFSRQFSTSPPACWTMMNSKRISERQDEQPSPSQLHLPCSLASFILNFWIETERAVASRYHSAHSVALLVDIARGGPAELSYISTPVRETEAASQNLWHPHRCNFPDIIF